MDMGATNEGIMTDGDQRASFSGDGSPSISNARGRALGRGSGPLSEQGQVAGRWVSEL